MAKFVTNVPIIITIRNQITSEALDKIEEIEIERANIERKEKKDKLVRKTVENYKKLAGREEEDG